MPAQGLRGLALARLPLGRQLLVGRFLGRQRSWRGLGGSAILAPRPASGSGGRRSGCLGTEQPRQRHRHKRACGHCGDPHGRHSRKRGCTLAAASQYCAGSPVFARVPVLCPVFWDKRLPAGKPHLFPGKPWLSPSCCWTNPTSTCSGTPSRPSLVSAWGRLGTGPGEEWAGLEAGQHPSREQQGHAPALRSQGGTASPGESPQAGTA